LHHRVVFRSKGNTSLFFLGLSDFGHHCRLLIAKGLATAELAAL
jgi:hypothetical protein